jgi:hypothetical protein
MNSDVLTFPVIDPCDALPQCPRQSRSPCFCLSFYCQLQLPIDVFGHGKPQLLTSQGHVAAFKGHISEVLWLHDPRAWTMLHCRSQCNMFNVLLKFLLLPWNICGLIHRTCGRPATCGEFLAECGLNALTLNAREATRGPCDDSCIAHHFRLQGKRGLSNSKLFWEKHK